MVQDESLAGGRYQNVLVWFHFMQVIVLKRAGGSPGKLTGFGDRVLPVNQRSQEHPQVCAFTASGALECLLRLDKEV